VNHRKALWKTIIIVRVHGNDDLKPGTLHGIMNDAGLTEDDL
jgi:predicted RNA binding protein YcfA (HicA-like mRNA interferase family)